MPWLKRSRWRSERLNDRHLFARIQRWHARLAEQDWARWVGAHHCSNRMVDCMTDSEKGMEEWTAGDPRFNVTVSSDGKTIWTHPNVVEEHNAVVRALRAALAREAAAREALRKYGIHKPLCGVTGGYEEPACTCGLDATLGSPQKGEER